MSVPVVNGRVINKKKRYENITDAERKAFQDKLSNMIVSSQKKKAK